MRKERDKSMQHLKTLIMYEKYNAMQNCFIPDRALWHFKHKAYPHTREVVKNEQSI